MIKKEQRDVWLIQAPFSDYSATKVRPVIVISNNPYNRNTPDFLAVHITNGYLDLVPVVWGLADHFHLERAVIEDPGDGYYTSASTWVLLARDPAVLSVPAILSRAKPMAGYTTSLRLWTDEYSNLFQILKH